MRAAIIIPAHNESATVAGVVRAVAEFGEVVVVDDGSGDDTAAAAAAAGADIVRHERNRGYDAALFSGLMRAGELGVDVAVTFDADGQHDARDLRVVLDRLGEGADLVLGIRPHPARWSEALFNTYVRWRFGVADILCGLKGYRMTWVGRHRASGRRSIGTELALAGLRRRVRVATVPVAIHQRAGASRMGTRLRANARILAALAGAVLADLTPVPLRRGL
ncbi:MAG: glycosyltransferase family 2 protein [Proteobacteria bacterium]|nr:glycosyltransferase family 2 protein [Pseudomonadota bacterium]